jgi:hypothetical protein
VVGLVVSALAGADVGGADDDADALAWAIAFSSVAIVAASTVPAGFTPNSVWNFFSA